MEHIVKFCIDKSTRYYNDIASCFLLDNKYKETKYDILKNIPAKNILDLVKFSYDKNYKTEICPFIYEWMKSINLILKDDNKDEKINTKIKVNPELGDTFCLSLESDILSIYQYMTILFYYSKYKDLGFQLSEKYYINQAVDKIDNLSISRYNCFRNLIFYINKLEGLNKIDVSYNKIKLETTDGYYNTCNPSIIKQDYGYLLNMRFVNYTQERAVIFKSMDIDQSIRTKNKLIKLDKNFKTIDEYQLIDGSWKEQLDKSKIRVNGMEDVIIFEHSGNIYASFTTLDSVSNYRPHQNIAIIPKLLKSTTPSLDPNGKKCIITDLKVMKSPKNQIIEKNWMPISNFGDNINIIYLHNPFIKLEINNEDINTQSNELDTKIINNIDHKYINLSTFRGSGGPLKIKDGNYLGIIHEVIQQNDRSRTYLHRFILYNKDITEILKISVPFFFDHIGIEFCRSICYHHDNDKIIITVGLEDKEGVLYTKNIDEIYLMLTDINEYIL